MSRATRVGWIVALAVLLFLYVNGAVFHGEPLSSLILTLRNGDCGNYTTFGDQCRVALFGIYFFGVGISLLLILSLLISGVRVAADRKQWRWLAGLLVPPVLGIVLAFIGAQFVWNQGNRFLTLTFVLSYSVATCVAITLIIHVIFAFWPRPKEHASGQT